MKVLKKVSLLKAQYSHESGQALVLVLLSLAVVLTLVLFILSRSVTDVLVSSKTDEAARAFSAAEAGIEQALVIGTSGGGPVGTGASYTSDVSDFAEGATEFNYPIKLASGDSMTTWFVNHDLATGEPVCDASHPCFTGTAMQVCWGESGASSGDSTTPAVEVSVFYESTPGSTASTKIARAVFDPNTGRLTSNSFTQADNINCSIGGENYPFQKTITFSDVGIASGVSGVEGGLRFARIRILYTGGVEPVGVAVIGGTLPSQGQNISSTGVSGVSQRKVDVFQGWPEAPSVFDYSIYSSTGITK